jgi:hypothetical protein
MPSLEHLIGCLAIIMCCATVLGVIHSCFSSNLHSNMPTRLAMQSHCLEGEGWAQKMRWSSGQLASISAELAPHAERFQRTCIRRALHIRGRITKINEAIKHLACGACSAVVSRTCVAPLERVKMEVILNHKHGNSWRRAVSHIWRDGGVFPVPVLLGQLMQGKSKQQRGSSQTLNDTQIVFLQCPQYLITSRTMFAATGTNKGLPHGLVLICYRSILMLVVECHSWSWDPLRTSLPLVYSAAAPPNIEPRLLLHLHYLCAEGCFCVGHCAFPCSWTFLVDYPHVLDPPEPQRW